MHTKEAYESAIAAFRESGMGEIRENCRHCPPRAPYLYAEMEVEIPARLIRATAGCLAVLAHEVDATLSQYSRGARGIVVMLGVGRALTAEEIAAWEAEGDRAAS